MTTSTKDPLGLITLDRDIARDHVRRLQAEILRYRDKLLELAKECSECDGTGVITVWVDDREVTHALDRPSVRTMACEVCADIRDVLGH